MTTLSMIPLAKLRATWPLVRDRIEELLVDDPACQEDVFHEILLGNAYLWTTADLEGFVILQILSNPYSRDLHVWLAYNRTDTPARAYFDELRDIAAQQNPACTRVTFASWRPGFERLIPGLEVRFHYSMGVKGDG